MENNLDLLTKKLYAEGVEKARVEAEALLSGARAQAEKLVADAMQEAAEIRKRAEQDAAALAKKSETELEASTRMAVDALKQEITGLVAGRVADGMARQVMEDRKFVQGMVLEIVKRWDVSSGGLDLAVVLSDGEKDDFRQYVEQECQELLGKGLEIQGGGVGATFSVCPRDGGYKVVFSEDSFRAFFSRYVKGIVKKMLYQES